MQEQKRLTIEEEKNNHSKLNNCRNSVRNYSSSNGKF